MAYRVERALGVERDLDLIFDHLAGAYAEFGETRDEALIHAAGRIEGLQDQMDALGRAPHQGTLRPELGPQVRSVTKARAVFYFEVYEDHAVVRVLAVFFGGQDHNRHMLMRLRGD